MNVMVRCEVVKPDDVLIFCMQQRCGFNSFGMIISTSS